MPGPPLDNVTVYEIAHIGRAFDQMIVNVLHFVLVSEDGLSPPTITGDYNDLLVLLSDKWCPNIIDPAPGLCLTKDYKYRKAVLRGINGRIGKNPNAPDIKPFVPVYGGIWEGNMNTEGMAQIDPAPLFVAATTRKITGMPGRIWRGSLRLSPIPRTYINTPADPNRLTGTARNTLFTNISAYVFIPAASLGTNVAAQMVVYSQVGFLRAPGLPGDAVPLDWVRPVVNVYPNDLVGSQTSRKTRSEFGN